MINDKKKILSLYILLGCIVLFPLAGGYVLSSGMVREWLAVYRFGNSLFWNWLAIVLPLQEFTIVTSYLFFRKLFPNNPWTVLCGVLLYVTCPFRVCVSYDMADFAQMFILAFLPLGALAVLGLTGLAKKGLLQVIIGVICTAAVLLAVVWCSGKLYEAIPAEVVADKGYQPGEWLHLFVYRVGHPGMGAALLFCIVLSAWFFYKKGICPKGAVRICFLIGLCLTVLSLRLLSPVYQALPMAKGLLRAANLFGWGQLGWCALGAFSVEQAQNQEQKLYRVGIPVLVMVLCFASLIYQCNMLAYYRVPLYGI